MGRRRRAGHSRGPSANSSLQEPSKAGPAGDPFSAEQLEQLEYTRMMYALQYSSGPLPPPATLEHYAQLIPGGGDRIAGWAEKQADHRRALEMKRIDADIRNETRGQLFAFTITMASLFAGTFLIYIGRDAYGLTLMLGELATLAGVFIYSNVSQKKELHRKMQELLGGEPGSSGR
jgi:uncharacterized membrane protein